MMTRTFWIVFTDGVRALGVAIIDVTQEQAESCRPRLSMPLDEAHWEIAALERAHKAKCYPGGWPLFICLDEQPLARRALMPRGQLMTPIVADALWEALGAPRAVTA